MNRKILANNSTEPIFYPDDKYLPSFKKNLRDERINADPKRCYYSDLLHYHLEGKYYKICPYYIRMLRKYESI